MHTPVNITGIKRETQNLYCNRIYRYIITGNDRTGGLTRESRALFRLLPPAAILDEMKGPKSAQFLSFRPRWPTNKLAGGNKRKSAESRTLPSPVPVYT